jgi:type IV pilus assembly protein PilV
MSRRSSLPPSTQRGVSLIEVLVAIVVLSIGLLGLAGLQASGLRVGQSSIHRSQAAQLAYDVVDRIRVNVAHAGLYSHALSDAMPSCSAAPTTGEDVAPCDLRDWRLRLQSLPSGKGSVAVDGTEVTVVIQWDDTRGAGVLRGTSEDDAELAKLQTSQFQLTTQLAN